MKIVDFVFEKENFESEEELNELARVSDPVLEKLVKAGKPFVKPLLKPSDEDPDEPLDKVESPSPDKVSKLKNRKKIATAFAAHRNNVAERKNFLKGIGSLKDGDLEGRRRKMKNLLSVNKKLAISYRNADKAISLYQKEKNKSTALSSKKEWADKAAAKKAAIEARYKAKKEKRVDSIKKKVKGWEKRVKEYAIKFKKAGETNG